MAAPFPASPSLARLLRQKPDEEANSEEGRRKRFRRAVVFVVAGAVLFAESLALALPYL